MRNSSNKLFCKIADFSAAPVDAGAAGIFRIAVGFTFCALFATYLVEGRVEYFYALPKFHFKYFGFSWVNVLPAEWMARLFVGLLVASACVMLGFAYRLMSLLLAFGYTYVFLLDKSQYQNHYYLLMLTTWVLVLVPTHRALSVNALISKRGWRFQFKGQRRSGDEHTLAAWHVWLLRFHVGLPYFFGGVAKVNYDWMNGQPLRMFLANSTWYPVLGPYFTEEWAVQIFVWGGMLFDLLIVPLLLWKRTRLIALAVAVCFHLMNATLFNIGVFPWFMIFATLIFLPPDWPRVLNLGRRRVSKASKERLADVEARYSRWAVRAACVYVCVQLLLPWRHHFYPDHVSWNERGHFFAWRMKLRDKKSVCKFKYRAKDSGEVGYINPLDFVTPEQAMHATGDPEMIVQFCRFARAELERQGKGECEVFALNLTSLNGRKPQPLVNAKLNLAAVSNSYFLPSAVFTKLEEPLRPFDPWKIPRQDWVYRVEIPNRDFWFGEAQANGASSINMRVNDVRFPNTTVVTKRSRLKKAGDDSGGRHAI